MKRNPIYLILGAFLLGNSLFSAPFTDNGDGTVKDNATGLIWQKCTFGRTYSNGMCSGTASSLTWANAITSCNGLSLAGKTWRLPNRNELLSIVDYTRTDVAIDISVFDYVSLSSSYSSSYTSYYISSSTYFSSSSYVWSINFSTGNTIGLDRNSTYYVSYIFRCVAGP